MDQKVVVWKGSRSNVKHTELKSWESQFLLIISIQFKKLDVNLGQSNHLGLSFLNYEIKTQKLILPRKPGSIKGYKMDFNRNAWVGIPILDLPQMWPWTLFNCIIKFLKNVRSELGNVCKILSITPKTPKQSINVIYHYYHHYYPRVKWISKFYSILVMWLKDEHNIYKHKVYAFC